MIDQPIDFAQLNTRIGTASTPASAAAKREVRNCDVPDDGEYVEDSMRITDAEEVA